MNTFEVTVYTIISFLLSIIIVDVATPDIETMSIQLDQKLTSLQKDINARVATLEILNSTIVSNQRLSPVLVREVNDLIDQRNVLNDKINDLEIISTGQAVYVATLALSQERLSLDLWKHIKDAMNVVKLDIIVSKDEYNRLTIGHDYLDNFRIGSFILNGTFSSWNIQVIDKKIMKK